MPYRLLLADDSLTIQKVVELTFPDPEYDLLAVGNGDKALDALSAFQPDIVLADVVMPGPTGYDICEAVRKRPGGNLTPVVLLTGTFEPFDRARADRVGATAVVTKPFDSHALASLVKDLLHKAAEQRATAEAEPPAAEPAPAPAIEEADDDTMTLGQAPRPEWGANESAAADLFAEEPETPETPEAPAAPSAPEEPEELYATSAIPIASLASALAPPPPPPVAPPPPPPPAPADAFAMDEEPLLPPPAFETARVEPIEAAWELTAPPAVAEEMWEVPPEADTIEAPAVAPHREEATQPLQAAPPPRLDFEPSEPAPMEDVSEAPTLAYETLEPTAAFEPIEQTEAIDIHSPSTRTAVLHAAREPQPIEETPLSQEESEPPAAFAAMESESPAVSEMPEPGITMPLEAAAAPAPGPVEEVFAIGEQASVEPTGAEPVALETVTDDVTPIELPDLGVEEPIARDIDDDIAAFESGGQTEREETPGELEALAANVSLTDLIPPAVAAAPAATAGGPLSDGDVERIARRVAELIGERTIRDIAWEVVPELAERLVRERLAEIERP